MGKSWTEEQLKVIQLRNRNILVSAAAGSGKTATLVERIIEEITDEKHPVDIDRILVVTFTRAAAAQMRERIGDRLEKLRSEKPDDENLRKQALLLHSAQITTIDSFCLSVIQNYFQDINLDPVFRIADEEELKLLRHDALQEVLEEAYKNEEKEFIAFSDTYGGKHKDDQLEELVEAVYRFSESLAWPEQWLGKQIGICAKKDKMEDAEWVSELLGIFKREVSECIETNKEALRVCALADGPMYYSEALTSDREMLDAFLETNSYTELCEKMADAKFATLSRKPMPECKEENKERVKALRDLVKDQVKKWKTQLFPQMDDVTQEEWEAVQETTGVLLKLVLAFREKLAQKKEEKHILDFSDIEHLALKILVEETENGYAPRNAALELREQFEEIMIDEYQDSNDVQETILTSISRVPEQPNIFMVGDVKQSIYQFRQAKPELFLEKYNTYSLEESAYQRIDLHKNFRSRAEVLEGINEIFRKIMRKEVGGIEYNADEELNPGMTYPDRSCEEIGNEVELLLVTDDEEVSAVQETNHSEENTDGDEQQGNLMEEEQDYSAREKEALCCAKKIKELIGSGFTVKEETANGEAILRPCRYSDIVILERSMANCAEMLIRILGEQGIPAVADTHSGYFTASEIRWLLNYLRIIDNPKQDLPLVSVLLSPFGGMTAGEIALIRSVGTDEKDLYQALHEYMQKGRNRELLSKIQAFLDIYEPLRARSRILSVSALVKQIFERTGYDYFVLAMPAGHNRYENLNMFLEKAAAFEKSSYRGLFQFIRYIDQLIKYDVDYGEAAVSGENDNVVRIMSIHHSKGLEFPIVFVAGMTKKMNETDLRSTVIAHPKYGVAIDYINPGRRYRVKSVHKQFLARLKKTDMIGEELRLLYVAMTRAMEKLYLVGYEDNPEHSEERKTYCDRIDGRITYTGLMSSKSYFDFISPIMDGLSKIKVTNLKVTELAGEKETAELNSSIDVEKFLNGDYPGLTPSEEKKQELIDYLQFEYPYAEDQNLPIKTSVSEWKKKQFREDEFVIPQHFEQEEKEAAAEATTESKTMSGTDRGTLYHKVFECLPLTICDKTDTIKTELMKLVEEGILEENQLSVLNADKLKAFYSSDLAKRMQTAEEKGVLYREQPFVMAVPAKELYGIESKEQVLIQGIIDVFFEEEDGLVLVDYKTDYVPEEPRETLLRRYAKQMELYSAAMKEVLGKPVKEVLLYSLYLNGTVEVPSAVTKE